MNRPVEMRDDLDAYIATFDEQEQQELAHAEAALDLAILLYQARRARRLTQRAAAKRSGLQQQAISRWERSNPNIQLDTLRRYLSALGFSVDLVIRDDQTGKVLTTLGLLSQTTEPEPEAVPEPAPQPVVVAQPPLASNTLQKASGASTLTYSALTLRDVDAQRAVEEAQWLVRSAQQASLLPAPQETTQQTQRTSHGVKLQETGRPAA
jgi:transcriptional regulator with XRE-family HTH domain